jgi:hypothetical protein
MSKPGIDADGIAQTELVLAHVHDAKIEIGEGEGRPPRDGRPQ